MHNEAIIVWIYGAIVLAGGLMGYIKAKSKASLIAGATSEAILLLLGAAIWFNYRQGLIAAVIVSTLLLIMFAMRYLKTKKFMPSGFMAIISMGVFAFLLSTLIG